MDAFREALAGVPGGVLFDVVAVGGALGLWALLYAAVLYLTRVRGVEAAPATQDFGGEEPPAVVALLVEDWEITEDAVEATVIDLAAKGYAEFRQPANDPRATTIHLLEKDPSPLATYENHVLGRLRTLAVGGVVPMTALTFRDEGEARSWDRTFRNQVVDDARGRGLSRARVSGAGVSLLAAAAAVVGVVVAAVVTRHTFTDDDGQFAGVVAGFAVFTGLGALARRDRGERDTDAGRAAASRWLGLARHLRGDEVFATLPPASVAVWDRYLAYGTAVGAARVCSAVLDLGMGSRKLVWSSFGGTWHRVRVRYPRMAPRYGMWGPRLTFGAVWPLVLGVLVYRQLDVGVTEVTSDDVVTRVVSALALVLVLRGLYAIVRTALDLASPVSFTGEVLWRAPWRSKKPFGLGRQNKDPVPWSEYLAVDDGSGPSTTAWAVPLKAQLEWAGPGDVVSVTARRWSRRILTLSLVERRVPAPAPAVPGAVGSAGPVDAADVAGPGVGVAGAAGPGVLGAMLGGVVTAGVLDDALGTGGGGVGVVGAVDGAVAAGAGVAEAPGGLVTAQEVSDAVGRPVPAPATAQLGPMSVISFATGGSAPLRVTCARGRLALLAARARGQGTALPGIGDEAWSAPGFAWARTGDTVVTITYQNTNVPPAAAESLLRAATTRA